MHLERPAVGSFERFAGPRKSVLDISQVGDNLVGVTFGVLKVCKNFFPVRRQFRSRSGPFNFQLSGCLNRAPLRFRHYTDEFRRQVVADARQTSIGDAARKHGVTWYSVRTWLDSGKFGLKAKAAGQ